jgi:hypothetical protein
MAKKEFQSSGKTCIKYRGKKVCRYKAGSSLWDKEYQKGPKSDYSCDCGAPYGKHHSLGCDCEQCPICRQQLMECIHRKLFEDWRSKEKREKSSNMLKILGIKKFRK